MMTRLNRHAELTNITHSVLEDFAREAGTTLALIRAGKGPQMPDWFYRLEYAVEAFGIRQYREGGR